MEKTKSGYGKSCQPEALLRTSWCRPEKSTFREEVQMGSSQPGFQIHSSPFLPRALCHLNPLQTCTVSSNLAT